MAQEATAGAAPIDGSRLCLACGLCCQGLLHDWARLETGEVGEAQRLGLQTATHKGEATFSLPCPCHRAGRCTIYQERLSPCREYRCKLLRGHLAGRITLDEGLRRVEQANRLIAALRERLGDDEGSIWQRIRAAGSRAMSLDTDLDTEAQLEAAALLTHCHRHFWNESETTRTMEP